MRLQRPEDDQLMPGTGATAQRRPKASVGAMGIITTAERLFAEQGIAAVPLRQIAAAAGLTNLYSVQYHFDDRDGLLRAILEYRLPAIDARRRELFDGLTSAERSDVGALFDCTHRPLLESATGPNRTHFPGLLMRMIHDPQYRKLRQASGHLTRCGNEIADRLEVLSPQLSPRLFRLRFTIASGIVMAAIADPTLYGFLDEEEAANPQRAYRVAVLTALGCLTGEDGGTRIEQL
jgi:AcrR family transcriptional regulator